MGSPTFPTIVPSYDGVPAVLVLLDSTTHGWKSPFQRTSRLLLIRQPSGPRGFVRNMPPQDARVGRRPWFPPWTQRHVQLVDTNRGEDASAVDVLGQVVKRTLIPHVFGRHRPSTEGTRTWCTKGAERSKRKSYCRSPKERSRQTRDLHRIGSVLPHRANQHGRRERQDIPAGHLGQRTR